MKLLIKLALSLGILYIATRNINLAAVTQSFERLAAGPLLLAGALLSLAMILASLRWQFITRETEGIAPALPVFIRSFYRGAFINQGLPTTFGGDAVRVIDLARELDSKREAFGTVLLDRVIGLSGLLVINVVMLPYSLTILPAPLAYAIGGASALALLAVAGVLALPWKKFSHHHPALDLIAELNAFGRRVLAHPKGFLRHCLLSVVVHVCAILALYVLARQFGIQAGLGIHFVVQPSITIIALLPISLAGWGVREGSMVAVFALLGFAEAPVLATSLTFGVMAALITLPGLVFLIQHPLVGKPSDRAP